jgi:uncharacterized protein YegP (UPF0339 family)
MARTPGIKQPRKLVLYRDSNNYFAWKAISANGDPLMYQEGYQKRSDMLAALKRIKSFWANWVPPQTEDQTEDPKQLTILIDETK